MKTSDQNLATLILVATLFLHLGELKPSLVSIWLVRDNDLEEMSSGFKSRFSLCIVSKVQKDSPLDFNGNLKLNKFDHGEL